MNGTTGTLGFAHAQGTIRYALLGRPLSGGDIVQLCCSGGWLTGRFEWEGTTEAPASFHFSIELEGGRIAPMAIAIPNGALLRWA